MYVKKEKASWWVKNKSTLKSGGVQQGNVVKPPTKKSTQIRQN